MYELRCPECGQVVAAPFVRVGAVVTCGKCRVVYPVREQDFKRKTALAMAEGQTYGGGSTVLLEEEPHEKDPHDTDVTGLSGLSGLMKQEPGRSGGLSVVAAGPALASARPTGASAASGIQAVSASEVTLSVAASRQRAARQRHRRQARTLAMLVIVGLGIVALGLVGIYVMYQRGLSGGSQVGGTVSGPAGADIKGGAGVRPPTQAAPEPSALDLHEADPAEAAKGVVTPDEPEPAGEPWEIDEQVSVTRLDIPYWRPFNPPVALPAEEDQDVVVRQGRIVTGADGRRRYEAELFNESPTTVDRATLWLALVDESMREAFAGVAVPVSMLEAYSSQPIAVAIPDYIVDPAIRVVTWISVQQTVRLAVPLPMIRVQVQQQAEQTAMRIEARTPARGHNQRMIFHVTATDELGQSVGQWRVDYPRPSDPGTQVTFATRLPMTGKVADLQWSIQGYALD